MCLCQRVRERELTVHECKMWIIWVPSNARTHQHLNIVLVPPRCLYVASFTLTFKEREREREWLCSYNMSKARRTCLWLQQEQRAERLFRCGCASQASQPARRESTGLAKCRTSEFLSRISWYVISLSLSTRSSYSRSCCSWSIISSRFKEVRRKEKEGKETWLLNKSKKKV